MSDAADIRNDNAGFTLVEVLVAIAVTAIMMGSLATALRLMGDASSRGSREVDRIDMVSRALALIRQDFARMERAVVADRNSVRFVFEGTRSSMKFVVIEPNYPSHPGSYLITYDVRPHHAGSQLVRSRDIFNPDEKGQARRDESDEVVVMEGPYRFEFGYLTAGQRQQWATSWTDTKTMPRMVRLETTSREPRTPAVPTLIARPRVEAEITCLMGRTRPCSTRNGQLAGEAAKADDRQPGTPSGPSEGRPK